MALRFAVTFGSTLVLAAAAALGQPSPPPPPPIEQVLDASSALSSFRTTALSPDGTRVAWVETVRDPAGGPPRGGRPRSRGGRRDPRRAAARGRRPGERGRPHRLAGRSLRL